MAVSEDAMVRVKLIYSTVVSGGVWPAGSIIEIGEDEARSLLKDGLAAELAISDERLAAPTPALPKMEEHNLGEGDESDG